MINSAPNHLEEGVIKAVRGNIVEVEFLMHKPDIFEVLALKNDPKIKLQVHSSATHNSFYCLCLSHPENLSRGDKVTSTDSTLSIPVGSSLLGRVVDIFGDPIDGSGPLIDTVRYPIHRKSGGFNQREHEPEILETGIKVLDFFSPVIKGGKLGLFCCCHF